MTRAALTVSGLLVVLVATLMLFGLPVGHSLTLMFNGSFGNELGISRTLVKTIPLAITAMGIIVAWRAGMYNIGGEGQFVMGGLVAGIVAKPLISASVNGWIGLTAILIASIVGGALWGGLAGWLRTKRGVEVVISTILLNFIAIQLLAWAVTGPLKDPSGGLPLSVPLPDSLMLHKFDPQQDLHAGIFVAVLAVVATYVFLYRMKAGFETRLVGEGEMAARANRIDTNWVKVRAMLISGAFCGLAGGVEYTGIAGQLGTSFAQGWGFLAIPVALLGGLHPVGVALSALYFGALFAGSRNLAGFTAQGTTLIYIIQAAAVLGLIAVRAIRVPKQVHAEPSLMDLAHLLMYAVPVALAALGELVGQKSGVINIGLEGMMLIGAYFGLVVCYSTGSPWIGMGTGVVVGAISALVSGWFCIRLGADQVVVGTAINLLAIGLTGSLFQTRFGGSGKLLSTPALPDVHGVDAVMILLLASIPGIWFLINRTGWGLAVRSAGEYPKAAEAAGFSVSRLRFQATVFGGIFAGIAGAYLSVGVSHSFAVNMTEGRGFIAIAMVTFGRWRPLLVVLATLLIGFFDSLQFWMQAIGVTVPTPLLLALPYVVALLVLVFVGKGQAAPASLGMAYRREK